MVSQEAIKLNVLLLRFNVRGAWADACLQQGRKASRSGTSARNCPRVSGKRFNR